MQIGLYDTINHNELPLRWDKTDCEYKCWRCIDIVHRLGTYHLSQKVGEDPKIMSFVEGGRNKWSGDGLNEVK